MVYSSQRLDAKPVESCVTVRRRADPRCFLRRINSCRAAAGGEGGVEEGSGAGAVARAAAASAAFPNQPVRLPPSFAPSAVRRLRPKGAAPLLPSAQSSPFFFPE